ncbi:N-acetylmuramoyl-L-alanine amidase [Paraliomyxa miuraensis]|uniref:N-acetylmuramoyl-L-alanine amidase n=1 Tax=Paraliomyxa miuraensis TaxID=376150 RepID=UPI0022553B7F|nr:N-acetylmuramoyl-L-alanine amidase [Paraliomyxa miuraensis]MCX4241747.1 N-acetylmuramoyl-L-alanine amidase [Paraliomyxa miuraensis]
MKLKTPELEGDDVLELQRRIVAFGSKGKPVPCTGKFDVDTKAAVERFQKQFGLEQDGIVSFDEYWTIDNWAAEMKPAMEDFLDDYACDHSNVTGDYLKKCNELWSGHVKGKIEIVGSTRTAGGASTCKGFGSQLTQVALTSGKTWTYSKTIDLVENPGIDKTLFWMVMGVMSIYGVRRLKVNNGYRCNFKYFQINKIHGPASMKNHTGHAVDFTIPGSGIARPNGKSLTPRTSKAEHCNQIRDDLASFGIVETFDENTKNRGRTEPRKHAPTWVHLDTTVYEQHTYVKSVEEAIAPQAKLVALPVRLSQRAEANQESLSLLHRHVEQERRGGYFPIGANTIWHGGVHLRVTEGSRVYACLPGRIVAARLAMDPIGSYGSRNFVLIEHHWRDRTFFSLYMHLASQKAPPEGLEEAATWLKHGGRSGDLLTQLADGAVVALDVPVAAGDTLWASSKYGSGGHRTGLLHWEIFAEDHLFEGRKPSKENVKDLLPNAEPKTPPTSRKILIREFQGPTSVDPGETAVYRISKLNVADPTAEEKKQINWRVEWPGGSEVLEDHGPVLQLEVDGTRAGQEVRVMPYMNSPSSDIAVKTEVSTRPQIKWTLVEDGDNDYNVDTEAIRELFADGVLTDGVITDDELADFYADERRATPLRGYVCKFISEWGIPDLSAAIKKLVGRWTTVGLESRIKPYLWWKDAVKAGVDLPGSAHVWHYNPIQLLCALLPARLVLATTRVGSIDPHEAATDKFILDHDITRRDVWGRHVPRYSEINADWGYTLITVHHAGDSGAHTPQEIEEKHMVSNGWSDVGYHFLIDPEGHIYEGRRLFLQGAHVKDNATSTGKVGIIVLGDFEPNWWDDDDEPTTRQMASLLSLALWLKALFPSIKTLGGHRDWDDTACPGETLYEQLPMIRVKARLGAP